MDGGAFRSKVNGVIVAGERSRLLTGVDLARRPGVELGRDLFVPDVPYPTFRIPPGHPRGYRYVKVDVTRGCSLNSCPAATLCTPVCLPTSPYYYFLLYFFDASTSNAVAKEYHISGAPCLHALQGVGILCPPRDTAAPPASTSVPSALGNKPDLGEAENSTSR